LELLIHNTGYVADAVLSLFLVILVFFKGSNKKANSLFGLTSLAFVLYCISYLYMVNEPNLALSQFFGSFTLVALFIVPFNAHLAFEIFGLEKSHKRFLVSSYLGAILLTIFYLTDLRRFNLLPHGGFGYFESFFQPGPYFWLFIVYFFSVVAYFMTILVRKYMTAPIEERKRLEYFMVAFGYAYLLSVPIYLNIYGIHSIDMIVTAFLGLYTIPLAYGVFKYNLMDMNIAAKNVALSFLYTACFAGLTVVVNILNNYLIVADNSFPIWFLPLISGLCIALVGLFVLQQLRQTDHLKYEFINNISHKFRTPLTHIRWLAEDLREKDMDPTERNKVVDQIQFASLRLFELTNIVIGASQGKDDLYLYHFTSNKIDEIMKDIQLAHRDQIERKHMSVTIDIGPDVPAIKADKTRLQLALEILFDNALIYTPENGTCIIKVRQIGGEVIISFKDDGIGINPADIQYVFSKFYRAQNARHTDTEGMGIGLFMSKNIIEKHKGRIWVESKGENQGSTFSVALPIE